MGLDINRLSSMLFWDTDPSAVRRPEHRKWLMTRVLERGRWEDWQLLCRCLSVSEMKELAPMLKLQPKERNFLRNWIERHDVG
jgi:hypothetical protein